MKVITTEQTLEIKFERREIFWAARRGLLINRQDITNVEWFGGVVDRSRLHGLRVPGTALPFIFHAGSFWRSDGWELRYLYLRKPGYLVISTKNRKFRVLRISVSETVGRLTQQWFEKPPAK